MAKRGAAKQLTDQNWDQEEEAEEAGVFKAANDDVLKKREIKTAKRRAPAGEGGGGAFKGFTGFGAKATSDAPAPVFSFGTKGLPGLTPASNGDKPAATGFSFGSASKDPAKTDSATPTASGFKFTSASTAADTKTTSAPAFSFGTPGSSTKPAFSFGVKSSESKESSKPLSSAITFGSSSDKLASSSKSDLSPKKNGSGSNPKYLAQLKGLNEAVAKWIKDHVDKNPYILLTPIFKDYETYLEQIEKDSPSGSDDKKSPSAPTGADKEDSSGFSFSASKAKPSDSAKESPPKASPFTFASGTTSSSGLASGFSFKPSGTTATSGFSFKPSESEGTGGLGGSAAPFSFATGATAAASATPASTGTDADQEDYVPPKPETVEIKEDDALYTKRCKLFYQKDGTWTERGVGNIYLKPLNDKTQLLIRADNTLGTVLLNIVLSSAIPMKRQGKNNVSLICTPNPPIDPKTDETKPASLLIRVKTSEDADELLEQLNKHKS